MISGLMDYDQSTISSLHQVDFWHPEMRWYGPCGIGATRGLKGFEDFYQIPFLHAFPNRRGGNHKDRLAEGLYVASTGWPSVRATHLSDYLGVPATGQ